MKKSLKKHELVYSKDFSHHYYRIEECFFTSSDFVGDDTMEDFFSHRSEDSVSATYSPSDYTLLHYFYVQTTGHFFCASGYYCERKGLASFLLIHTLSGIGHLIYQNHNYTLTEGNCILINCMEYHKYYTDTNWEFVYIHFDGKEAPFYYQQSLAGEFKPITHHPSFGLDTKVYRLMALITKSPFQHELIIHNILTDILTEVIINTRTETFILPKYISEVQNYINQNLHNRITLDLIANEINLSKFYLSHEFKRYTNITIQEYISSRRVANAKFLLLNSDYSISEIADCCGLQTTSYFIKLFKTNEGISPHQWRKKWNSL